ncbi:MAG TPA: metallophosphoesterase [Thermoanaerobaculia bacterium]|jgi:predicted MPP superfamily phosphohydrolase|nr:metallophosphoesterase [Thermoanaerobaculia bacterium]
MKRIRTLARNGAAPIRFVALPAVWLALFAYAGRPVVAAARAGGLAPALAWGGIFLLSLLPILPMLVRRSDHLRRRTVMHWTGYATLAVFATLLILVAAGDLIRLGSFLASLATTLPLISGRALSFAILGAAGVLSAVGLVQARCPRVRRVPVAIDELPEALEGYRIVQWSDVHVGPTIQRRFVASLVERTNALDADAIAITGDLVDSYVHEVRDSIAPLRELRARDGVFYVTGNHEYYWRASEWIPELERHGLQFLKNEHRIIRRGEAKLVMAGVTDPVGRYTHKQDPDRALAGAPRDAVKVLLSHRPQTAQDADRLGVHLQLSGHTHGGQFFPFNLLIRWFQPVVAGLHRIGRTWLYVSRGTGYWGPPSRLGVHGEITVIELRRA